MSRPDDPKAPVREGDILASKYRVEKVIGAGGMGVVVAATQLEIDRRVALKFLLPGLAETDELINRFMREAKASVRLKGKHIAQVLDVGRLDDGRPYIVMEHLDGRDLGDELKVAPNPLPIELAASWILQACEGLAEAHALGIVHRDIKPGNIFLTHGLDGRQCVKVLDFGISKTIDPLVKEGLSSLTKTEMLLGSPLYMAPEQMRSSKHVDERSDIWGLGAILYELLTRKVPFVADTLLELCFKVAQESPPDVRNLRDDVPEELATVVMRCLDKDATKRWANVGELATALEPFAQTRDRGTAERTTAILSATPRPRMDSLPDAPRSSDPKPSDPEPSDPKRTIADSPSARRLVDGESGSMPAPEASGPAAWGTTHAERLEKRRKGGLALAAIVVVAAAAIAGVMLGKSSSAPAGLVPPPASTLPVSTSTPTPAPPDTKSADPIATTPSATAAPKPTPSAPPSATSTVVARPRPAPAAKPSATTSAPKPPTSTPSDPGFIKVRE
jgi:eukaryotic-like serine/threonine-protein kinase